MLAPGSIVHLSPPLVSTSELVNLLLQSQSRSRSGREVSHVIVSSSVLTWQPQLAFPHSTTATGMKLHHWREFSRIVEIFRRVGRAGGKASLTTSTEGGHWKASLDIQMNLPTAAYPGQANATTPYSAAPGQDGAAACRRPRRRRGPASAMRSKARAAAYQATLVAARGGTGSMSPPCQADPTNATSNLFCCQAALQIGKNCCKTNGY